MEEDGFEFCGEGKDVSPLVLARWWV